MARIPVYDRRVAQDGSAPVARVSGESPIANALQGMGQVGMNIAEGMMVREARAQEEAKRKADKEAEDQAAVQVANLLSRGDVYWQQYEDEKRRAWTPGSGDMREGIGKDFDKWVEESKGALATPAAQKYFLQHAAGMRARLQTNAYTFQRKAVTAQLNAETEIGEADDERAVAGAWQDDKRVDEIITRRIETLMARSDLSDGEKLQGAQRIKMRMTLARERAHVENDPAGWLRANGRRVGAPAPVSQPAQFDTLFSAVVAQESGGVHTTKDGALLTSSAGAQGVTQVMPKTGTDPGYGVKPLQNQSREEYLRFGRDYLQAMLKEFDGDQAKALAAYNAGPGRVQDAIREGGANWLARLPQETKDYVSKISGKVGTPVAEPTPAAPEQPFELSRTASRLDPDQVYALRNLAETRVGQERSQFRAEGQRMVSDLMAGHKDGKVEAQPLGREYFDRAFGADGERIYAEYKQSRDMGADVASYRAMPASAIMADVAAAEPPAGEGYAAAKGRQEVRQRAAAEVLQARNRDPVTYAATTSPRVASLLQQLDATQDPQQRAVVNSQLIDASLAEQARLGVDNPRVLTPGQADRWQNLAMNAQRPEDSANLIATLETEYGKNFPRVFNELAREGKISGELLVIPNLPSQAARETVSRLARVKEADLSVGVIPGDQKMVKDKAAEAAAELVKSMPYLNQQSAGMAGSYEALIRKLAYEQIARGESIGDAVEKARTTLLGHYEFSDFLRMPKGTDVRSSKMAMDMLVRDLPEVDVPRDLAGARAPADARKVYTEIVKARPLWHTTDDDTGAQLFVVGDDGIKRPVTVGGQPLRRTWAEMKAMTARAVATGAAEQSSRMELERQMNEARARLSGPRVNRPEFTPAPR